MMMMSFAGIRWIDRRCPQAMEKSTGKKVNYMIRSSERYWLHRHTHTLSLIHTTDTDNFCIWPLLFSFPSFFSHLTFDRHTAFKGHCNLCRNFSSPSNLSADCPSASTPFKDQVWNSLRYLVSRAHRLRVPPWAISWPNQSLYSATREFHQLHY